MTTLGHIYKAGGILLNNRRLLVSKSYGKDIFFAPGGKLEAGETPEEALVRELKEELTIAVHKETLSPFGTFTHPVTGDEDRTITMHVFIVSSWEGTIAAANEIQEVRWVTAEEGSALYMGSIFKEEVIPRLKSQGLLD